MSLDYLVVGGDGQLVVVLLGGGLCIASTESCTLMVLAEMPFGGVLDDVLDVALDGVLNGVPPFSSVLLGF